MFSNREDKISEIIDRERLPSRDWDSANQKNRAGTTLPRDEERYKPEKTGCHILVAGMARLLRPCRNCFAKITAKVTIYTDLEYIKSGTFEIPLSPPLQRIATPHPRRCPLTAAIGTS